MKNHILVITSISDSDNPILKQIAQTSLEKNIKFILIGDTKSPSNFKLDGCDFYSVQRQQDIALKIIQKLPLRHYSRKNIGYLLAMIEGAEVIIETDDDNIPTGEFWLPRNRYLKSNVISSTKTTWFNVYKNYTDKFIWPRGFALEELQSKTDCYFAEKELFCPIQQGLADENPDVDAIYRLSSELPIKFKDEGKYALTNNVICPFNSQNTSWFKDAFPLLYLPSYCSFRMTDIWRSFIAQRIAWTCDWPILFHQPTVYQLRNEHDLMKDFIDEIVGYTGNKKLVDALIEMDLQAGPHNIQGNMLKCYEKLIDLKFIENSEIGILNTWFEDINEILKY